jgi:hypothetical protein
MPSHAEPVHPEAHQRAQEIADVVVDLEQRAEVGAGEETWPMRIASRRTPKARMATASQVIGMESGVRELPTACATSL